MIDKPMVEVGVDRREKRQIATRQQLSNQVEFGCFWPLLQAMIKPIMRVTDGRISREAGIGMIGGTRETANDVWDDGGANHKG